LRKLHQVSLAAGMDTRAFQPSGVKVFEVDRDGSAIHGSRARPPGVAVVRRRARRLWLAATGSSGPNPRRFVEGC
jgi:hypothetical protein